MKRGIPRKSPNRKSVPRWQPLLERREILKKNLKTLIANSNGNYRAIIPDVLRILKSMPKIGLEPNMILRIEREASEIARALKRNELSEEEAKRFINEILNIFRIF